MTRRLVGFPVLGVAALFALFPIYWMVITAFKSTREIFTSPPSFWPAHPSLANFESLFHFNYMGSYLRNSVVVVAVSVGISLVIGSLAAYALARFQVFHRSNEPLSFGILAVRMIPPIVIVVPIYLSVQRLGLLNSYGGLILVYSATNLPFVIWMMRSFFEEIPVDLEEAAMADGASRLSAFRTVALPLAAPGLVATSIFAVIVTYNEFIYALVITSTPNAETVPVGASTLIGKISVDFGPLAAAGVIAMIPIVIFALAAQRHLIRGLTMGALK
jgi:multiple sugar transport system permease protein